MLKIDTARPVPRFALFQLGFRPFFFAAGLFGVIAVGLWMLDYVFHIPLHPRALPPTIWHAHQMLYSPADTTGNINLGSDGLPRLSNLPFQRHPSACR